MLGLSDIALEDEARNRVRLLRARAAHARELKGIAVIDARAHLILVNFAAELEREAAELERQVQVSSIEKASQATELSARFEVAAMEPKVPNGSGEDLAALYRERAKRLRTLVNAIQDTQQIQLLKAIAEDYDQLADRLSPP